MAYLVNRTFNAGLVQRTPAGYIVEIPVPGFAPEQIEANLEETVLTVKGEAENRRFSRSLQVPEEIDADTISAKVEHGLLTLTLNVQAKLAPRKIPISSN